MHPGQVESMVGRALARSCSSILYSHVFWSRADEVFDIGFTSRVVKTDTLRLLRFGELAKESERRKGSLTSARGMALTDFPRG